MARPRGSGDGSAAGSGTAFRENHRILPEDLAQSSLLSHTSRVMCGAGYQGAKRGSCAFEAESG